jgi:hypothetical protein
MFLHFVIFSACSSDNILCLVERQCSITELIGTFTIRVEQMKRTKIDAKMLLLLVSISGGSFLFYRKKQKNTPKNRTVTTRL